MKKHFSAILVLVILIAVGEGLRASFPTTVERDDKTTVLSSAFTGSIKQAQNASPHNSSDPSPIALHRFDLKAFLGFTPPRFERTETDWKEPEKERRGDEPDEALKWRMLQQVDENGSIPQNALINAWSEARQVPYNYAAWRQNQEESSKNVGPIEAQIAGIQPTGWTWLGPGNIGGRIRSILVHPNDSQTRWIGSVSGGIWKTTNGGNSWIPLDDFMGNLAVSTMTMGAADPNVIYAGTGEGFGNFDSIRGAGVFKTTNGGTTWAQLSSTANSNWTFVNRLTIHPTSAQVILAATSTGIWRSTDGGTSWTNRNGTRMLDIDFHPTNGNLCIASGTGSTGAFYSSDGGINWNAATGLPSGRIEIAYSRSNPQIVYASVDSNSGEVYRSTNGGQSYTLVNTGLNYLGDQGWYDNVIWVDPTDSNNVLVGGIFLWRSTNGGTSFNTVGSLHVDHHAIVELPQFNGTTNRSVLFGNDGGIYQTNDIYASPLITTELNNNLGITQFYGGAGNSSSGRIIGGTQDNGTLRYTGGTENWNGTAGGDGGFCAADQTDSNYFYGEYQWLQIHRSTDGGSTSNQITTGLTDATPQIPNFIAPFVLDPNNPNTLLAGGASLWRSTNAKAATPTWMAIRASIGSNISAIAVAKGNSNIIWVGHNNGEVYFTTNGTNASPNWTRADDNSPGLPNRFCTRISIDPTNSNKVFVTFGGFNSNNVWRTTNSGTSWTSITSNLPNAPVRTLAIWEQNPNNLYVGTEVGIFASADGGQTWSPSNDGPTNCSVDELFWMGNTLVAATHGRGMFSIPITDTVSCAYSLNPTSRDFNSSGGSSSFTVTTGATCSWTTTVNAPSAPQASSSTESASALWVNLSPITVNDRTADSNPPGTASLYPSTINVSGMSGTIAHVDVGLNGVSHTFPDDIDVLLVGPGGQSVMLMSDVGGTVDMSAVDLIFEQSANASLPDSTQVSSGTYRPTNYTGTLEPGGVDTFPSPGPGQGTYSSNLDTFKGTSPNGAWKLYIVDDEQFDTGSFAHGWALGITTTGGETAWITITSGSSGTGNGTVNYSVAASSGANQRSGTITVNGQVHTITQIGIGGAGNVRFNSATYSANENGGNVTITVTRTGGTESGSVQYSTSNGTATAGVDYTAASGTLLFGTNETSKSFTVPILDDTLSEGNETINLSLNNQSLSFTLGNPSTATLTIVDNDGLSAPTANAATNISSHGLTANWATASGATGYRLDVSTNNSFSSFVSGYQNLDVGNSLSRPVTGLNASTLYHYRVRAYNAGGTSANSNTITVSTLGPIIFIEQGTANRAAALDSVLWLRGPFRVLNFFNFTADNHTRVMIFASDLGMTQPDPSQLNVRAGGVALAVESVGPVVGVAGMNASYIIVRLPDGLPAGDLPLVVTLRGLASVNSPTISISP